MSLHKEGTRVYKSNASYFSSEGPGWMYYYQFTWLDETEEELTSGVEIIVVVARQTSQVLNRFVHSPPDQVPQQGKKNCQ